MSCPLILTRSLHCDRSSHVLGAALMRQAMLMAGPPLYVFIMLGDGSRARRQSHLAEAVRLKITHG
eukprot:6172501-Pleurochrysis_carterae.AAC.1